MVLFQCLQLLFFFEFSQSQVSHKESYNGLNMDQLFLSYLLVKTQSSPASTAGLDNIILSIFFSRSIVSATATAKYVFPVPAGPAI